MTMFSRFQFNQLALGLLWATLPMSVSAGFTSPAQTLRLPDQTHQIHQTHASQLFYHATQHPPGGAALPVAIVLGGGPGFTSWNLQPVQALIGAQGYKTLLMDMRGLGENAHLPTAPAHIVAQWVADIEHLRMAQGARQVTLIGHSWGALMALLYARHHPEKVAQIVLLNPVDPEKQAMQHLTETIHERNRQQLAASWDDESAWNNAVPSQIDPDQARQITQRQITQVLPTYFYDYAQGSAYARQFSHRDFDIDLNVNAWKAYDANPIRYAEMRAWSIPIDFMDCHEDPLMPANLNALQSQGVLRRVELIAQCGHFPWVEQPAQFKERMLRLLGT